MAGGEVARLPDVLQPQELSGEADVDWLTVAVAPEILSCLGYVVSFLQVFERAPIRFGARVALSELGFNAAVSIGGAEGLLFSPDWRILGAIRYLWFDIAVLLACLAAAGASPPLAAVVLAYQVGYLSNLDPDSRRDWRTRWGLGRSLVLYGIPVIPTTAATVVCHAIALWIPAGWGRSRFCCYAGPDASC